MKCIYCEHDTKVINSRLQKRSNSIWRRRKCLICQSVFSTMEVPDLAQGFRVELRDGNLVPFSRTHLFVTIYEACKHLEKPVQIAEALTATVVGSIMQERQPIINRRTIVTIVNEVLRRFDTAAAVQYAAYHPL